ncbi:662790a5-39fa-4bdd-8c9e-ddefc677aab1 [Sclerotinia trifoliorum]|uniref:662790a5-39fa-4bdd-8c9e-ddefc677aab1 n=1 Tax=Sclerotinia trifoliorum TaxID=28548 RepID=A0A8H2W4K1_9HELO|nr:662790a5-39fa-4bdd-8c9e-ddefc677aab1 [Sclerotinia trifoliorum]
MVGLDIEWRIDSDSRRRSQNRIAQRKFRQSRKISKIGHNSNQPLSIEGAHSIVDADAPGFQNSASLGPLPPDHLNGVTSSGQTSDGSMNGFQNVAPYNDVSGIDDIGFIESLVSGSNSSLSTPQTTATFHSNFDPSMDFISINASNTPPSSSSGLDVFNFYGTLDNADITTRSDAAQHEDSGHISRIHPGTNLIPHNYKEPSAGSLSLVHGQSKGWLSALHIAARRGHEPIVRTLISHNIDCNEKDSDVRTALIHASIDGHESVVSLLLAHGARISDVDRRGRSAIYWATINQHEAVLRLLLSEYDKRDFEQGIDAYDDMGWTSLHIAIEKGFDVGVQLLLASGANLNAKASKTCNGDDDKDDSRIVQAE